MRKLKKELSLLHVFCIASGAMISSGLFVLPGEAFKFTGDSPAVVVSYLLAALLASAGMFSIAEIATAMPRAGGDYFFISRTLGPAIGSISGLSSWFAISMKSAFALVGMAAFTRSFAHFSSMPIAIPGAVFCLLFMLLNIFGVKAAARLQVGLVISLIALMIVYLATGLPSVDITNLSPFAPGGITPMLAGAGFVFISYGGLLKVVSVGEELKNPAKDIPRGMLISLVIVGLFYVLMVFVTVGVVPAGDLSGNLTPISTGAELLMGRTGFYLLSIAAICAFFSTANAGLASASRYLFAMSRDDLLPPIFSKVSARFGTPIIAIIFTSLVITVTLLMPLDMLVHGASTVVVLTYILACASHIILRESRLQNYRPSFRAPLYPWLQIAGIFGYGTVIYFMGLPALLVCLGIGLTGFLVYRTYGTKKVEKEYALLHLVERITSGDIVDRTLESELRDIIRDRDELEKDRFDLMIESCPILDIDEEGISYEELFDRIAQTLTDRLGISRRVIMERLCERERQSTTAISPDCAIPHVTIEGEHKFEMVVARAQAGVYFSDENPGINMIFALIGTLDERHFHLRSLAAIAQIVQDEDFEKRWKAARNADDLRDLLLLGTRYRHVSEVQDR
jgi:amino acid transporter/mannitol/fructose-specific phosphotransferase system IIA component (Ntr-type)